jgi:hypothetical protein
MAQCCVPKVSTSERPPSQEALGFIGFSSFFTVYLVGIIEAKKEYAELE